MDCSLIREAVSARLDGEAAPVDATAVDHHLAACDDCRAFAAGAAALHRRTRLRLADPVPDLSEAILQAAPHLAPPGGAPVAPRPPVREWARYALLTVALTQAVVALPALLLGDQSGATVHLARDLGTWDVALAAAWLAVAWAPRRAAGLLPFAAALAVVMSVATVVDVVTGRAPALTESTHLLDLAGLGLVWLLAGSSPSGQSLVPWRPARGPARPDQR